MTQNTPPLAAKTVEEAKPHTITGYHFGASLRPIIDDYLSTIHDKNAPDFFYIGLIISIIHQHTEKCSLAKTRSLIDQIQRYVYHATNQPDIPIH